MSCIDFTMTCIEQHVSQGLTTQYLTMLFGGWVQTYYGDETVAPTMSPVMVMIGGLNFLALLYGSINVLYTSSHMTLNAAATGHIFGKLSPYAPLRVGIAMASLAPMVTSAAGGAYVSVGQVTGMYVIVHGAGAADLFWRAGVNQYVNLTNAGRVSAISKNVFSSGETLTSMLLCSELFPSVNPKYTLTAKNSSGKKVSSSSTTTIPTISNLRTLYQPFPSYSDTSFLSDPATAGIVTSVSLEFAGGACGSLTLPMQAKTSNSASITEKAAYYSNYFSNDATLRHISNIQMEVKKLAKVIKETDIARYVEAYSKYDIERNKRFLDIESKHVEIAEGIYESHINLSYCHALTVERTFQGDFTESWSGGERSKCSSVNSSSKPNIQNGGNNNLLDELTEGGWIMSASSFSRMNGMMQTASAEASFTIDNFLDYQMPERGSFCEYTSNWYDGALSWFDSGPKSLDDKVDEADECRTYFGVSESPAFIWKTLRNEANKGTLTSSWADAQKSGNWADMLSVTKRNDAQSTPLPSNQNAVVSLSSSILSSALYLGNNSNNLASGISNPQAAGIDYDGALFDASGKTNAITMLATLGEGLKILHAIVLFFYAAASQSAETLSSSPITGFLGIPLKMLSLYLLPLVMSSLTGAFMLANIVPMIPTLTFVFIITAFLVICAEALGGIALGSALLASAVGEGLLAVHGLRMAALYGAIFLRPTLHVIGLMLGFAMCNISYALFVALWWGSIGSTTTSSWDVFDLVMIAGGMPMIICALMIYCLKTPNLYANNLMSWVATEAVGQFGDGSEYIESTKNTMNGISHAFNQGVKGADSKPQGGNQSSPPKNPETNDNKPLPPSGSR